MRDTTAEPGLNLPAAADEPASGERECRYRQCQSVTNRHSDQDGRNAPPAAVSSDGVTILCAQQSEITIELDEEGNAVLCQSDWPEEDDVILIRRENIPDFVDRLTAVLGVPSFG
jgi:hypothetical protein